MDNHDVISKTLPAIPMAPPLEDPLEALKKWLRREFAVVEGEKKGFYNDHNGKQRAYVVYALTARGETEAVRRKLACEHMHAILTNLKESTNKHQPLMVVRAGLDISEHDQVEYQDLACGFIQTHCVEDGTAGIPPGWQVDFSVGLWRPIKSRELVTKLYLRCDVPDAPSEMREGWGGSITTNVNQNTLPEGLTPVTLKVPS